MKIDEELHRDKKATITALRDDRLPWWRLWREVADYLLPKRYLWLMSPDERLRYIAANSRIVDPTGTKAGRVLASGMMNGITSPSRPWFKLRLAGFGDDADHASRVWLDEVERRLLLIMAESNFYNAMAIMYLDLVFFGTASMLIYEDNLSVIRCYNNALGEYYLGQSARMQVDTFAREFDLKVKQVVEQFGIENVTEATRTKCKQGGSRLQDTVSITHLIEPNDYRKGQLPKMFTSREYYWESTAPLGEILSTRGYHELPGVFPRWELTGNDSYGTSPGMDALPDVKQLQHETIRKEQSLDYMIRPPMVLDVQLQHRPSALMPGGQTFVAGVNNAGAKPAYQFNPPLSELTVDIREIQARIRETFFNDLFRMISELQTVRSATEIDARREEKLVQLGPVLERFENEALDPAVNRIFSIATRAQRLPAPPATIQGKKLEIQYVSILSTAQSATGVIPTERFLQLVGNLAGVYPKILTIPDFDELVRGYAVDIGVKAKGVRSREDVQAEQDAMQKQQAMAQGIGMAQGGAETAKLLSETEVGGGANALQQMMGQPT